MKIMIVDDEPSILITLSHLLRNKETTVIACSSIEEAEDALAQDAFDLVIADIRLTGMYGIKGLEIPSFIKKINADTAVIIITAYGTDETKVEAYKRGALHYYENPIDINDLISKVQAVM